MRDIEYGVVVHLGASSFLARRRSCRAMVGGGPMELDETHDMIALP